MGVPEDRIKAMKITFYVVLFSLSTVLIAGIIYLMASHFGAEHILAAVATGLGVVGATHLATRERE